MMRLYSQPGHNRCPAFFAPVKIFILWGTRESPDKTPNTKGFAKRFLALNLTLLAMNGARSK